MKGQAQRAWKPLEREFMLHKQQMVAKTENGECEKTEAQWKKQN
jgi:hypothetical protein